MGMREEDLAGLSDEERLALSEDDETVEEATGAEEESELPEVEATSDEVHETPATVEPQSESEDEYEEPFVARYQADPVEGYSDKLSSLDTQFEDGDITLKEYNTQREQLLKQQLKAEIAEESRQQADQQKWKWEIERFMEDNSTYQQDPIMYAALDAAIKSLAAKPEYSDKNGRWFLNEAHKQVTSRFGQSAPTAKPDAKKPAKQLDVPRTLSTLPAADTNETGGDEFSNIEALFNKGKVIEAERMLAKLTPDQQTRYLEALS